MRVKIAQPSAKTIVTQLELVSFYSLPSNDPQLNWAPGLPPDKSGPAL